MGIELLQEAPSYRRDSTLELGVSAIFQDQVRECHIWAQEVGTCCPAEPATRPAFGKTGSQEPTPAPSRFALPKLSGGPICFKVLPVARGAARLMVALQEPQVRAEREQLRALPHRAGPCPFPTPTALLCRLGAGQAHSGPCVTPTVLWGTNLGSLLWTSIFYYSGKTCQINTRPNKPEAFLAPGPPHRLIQDPHAIRDCACRRILIKTSNSQGLAGQAAWPRRVSAIPGLGGQEALLGTSAPKTNTEQQAGFVFSL